MVVRFFPIRYVPPSRVHHELTPLQQEILLVLAELGPAPSTQIRPHLSREITERAVLDNLRALRHLGLVEKTGMTRGARWSLTGRHS